MPRAWDENWWPSLTSQGKCPESGGVLIDCHNILYTGFLQQAFRCMVGPGHCPMISKYSPSLSKALGPVDPSFIVVKKSHFN